MNRTSRLLIAAVCAVLLIQNRARGDDDFTEQKLSAPSPAALDFFGRAVAVSGDFLMVGAPGDDDLGSGAGSVHVFERSGDQWLHSTELHAGDGAAGNTFGFSVAMEGERAVIGALIADGPVPESGAVYVFRRVGGQWVEEQKLSPPVALAYDEFGSSLDLAGDRIVVGAPAGASATGQAYAITYRYESTLTSWVQEEVLGAGTPVDSNFGRSVALHGDRLVIGAPFDSSSGSFAGAAYAYEHDGSSWTGPQVLHSLDLATGDAFGWSVDLEGELLAVSAYTSSASGQDAGAVYLFEQTAGSWIQSERLAPPDLGDDHHFGDRLVLDEGRLAVGATGSTPHGFQGGKLYVFEAVYGSWHSTRRYAPTDAHATQGYGSSLALSGERWVVGAVGDDDLGSNAGAAYAHEVRPSVGVPICHGDGVALACPCANEAPGIQWRGCTNSTGAGAHLVTAGSDSLALDDLVLRGCALPPSQPAALFTSTASASPQIFGDGLGCLGSNGTVLALGVSGPGGGIEWGPSLGSMAGWMVGQSHFFEVVYRDSPPSPCGARLNVTGTQWIQFRP